MIGTNSIYIKITLILVFIISIYKLLLILYNSIKRYNSVKNIQAISETENVSFDKAKELYINNKVVEQILEQIKIEQDHVKIGEMTLSKGNKISFDTKQWGRISGEFLGIKNSKANGYTWHFYLKKNNENKIIGAPIEIIDISSLMIYER